ncbi:5085_t:CDS:2 [Entrophospora sp. SA101]|nr:12250_t:CDS:2 [Entrophospora sp. SA101]CAJ0750675.1 5085_t:CDS:2 [Entrophospora sp. SA101]
MGGAQSTAKGQGYHVLKVHENSPAHSLGIEPFFDYIVGINGLSLDTPSSFILQEQLYNNIDKKVILLIYSTKEQEFREVSLVPNKNWSSKLENGLIGCSIRYCSYESINEHVWHILDIAPDNYVIGSPHATLRGENDFYELVESNLGKPIRIYVYNADFDVYTTENSSLTDNSTTISTNDFILDTNTDTTTFSDIPLSDLNTTQIPPPNPSVSIDFNEEKN